MSMQLHHTLMGQYKHGTVSGIGSVSYESVANCITPEIVIYGKCVQNGTPTPDAPVDIIANNNIYSVNGSYYPIPTLYGIGDVRDEYYPLTGKIVRRCGNKEVKAEWQQPPDGSPLLETHGKTFCFDLPTGAAGYQTSICSHFENVDESSYPDYKDRYGIYADHPTVTVRYFRAPNESVTTVAEFNSWLDEQKAAGTPVTLVYVLAEPVIEYVEPVVLTSKRSIGKKIILDSSCDIRAYTYQNTKNGIAVYGLFPTDEVVYNALTCTHESSYKDDGTEYSFMFINANLKRLYWVGILDEMGISRAQFISWLDEQKAAGTPVTVTYFPNGSFNTIEETDLNSNMFGIPFVEGTQIDVKYLTHS